MLDTVHHSLPHSIEDSNNENSAVAQNEGKEKPVQGEEAAARLLSPLLPGHAPPPPNAVPVVPPSRCSVVRDFLEWGAR